MFPSEMEAPSDDINAVAQSPETEPAETVAENEFRSLGLSEALIAAV